RAEPPLPYPAQTWRGEQEKTRLQPRLAALARQLSAPILPCCAELVRRMEPLRLTSLAESMRLARPKSVIFGVPYPAANAAGSPASRTLAGFRSRWTMPRTWAQ